MKLRWLWNAWDYSCVIWCIWQISRVTNCTRKIFQGFVFEQTLLNFTRTSSQFQKCTFNTIYGKHWLLKNCCSRVTTFNFSGVNSCQRFFHVQVVLCLHGFLNNTVYFGILICPFSTKLLLCLHGFLLTRLFFQSLKKQRKQRTACSS